MQLCDPDVQSLSGTFIFSSCLERIACCVNTTVVKNGIRNVVLWKEHGVSGVFRLEMRLISPLRVSFVMCKSVIVSVSTVVCVGVGGRALIVWCGCSTL
jgi:hypothetical protein